VVPLVLVVVLVTVVVPLVFVVVDVTVTTEASRNFGTRGMKLAKQKRNTNRKSRGFLKPR